MRMLAALTAGWILAESLPGSCFAGPAGSLIGSTGGTLEILWLVAGALWAIAWVTERVGGAGWTGLLAIALGAWLPNALLDTPFFRLGPLYGGLLLWLLGAVLWSKERASTPLKSEAPACLRDDLALSLLAGFSAALPILALWRIWSRLGQSEPADTAIGLPVLWTLLALGAFSFGRLVSERNFRSGRGWALLALGFSSLFALHSAESLATNRGLRTLVRRWGLDLSEAGTYRYDALVGISLWVLPAFCVGMFWFCTEHRRQRLVFGAGVLAAIFAQPRLLASLAQLDIGQGASQGLLGFGAALCALGTVWALWPSPVRLVGTVGGIALLAAALRYPYQPLEIAKPWSRTAKDVVWCKEYPAGQCAVYNEGTTGFSARLDQRAITPVLALERLDQRMLLHSMALLPPEQRQGARVLLGGLLTPSRLHTLLDLGARSIDRLGWEGGPGSDAEKALFGNQTVPTVGSVVALAQAEERVKDGAYDLIVVLPSGQTPNAMGQPSLLVQWYLADEGLAELPSGGEAWMLAADGLQRFAAARIQGVPAGWVAPPGAARVALGAIHSIAPRRAWHNLREWERIDEARTAFFERLELAATDEAERSLFVVLRDLQRAQRHSSPFENEAQGLEMDATLAERLHQVLLAQKPGPFLEELAGGLARILVGKRDIEGVFRWLPALSEGLGQPYELERSLALAERESLDPSAAATRLKRLQSRFPKDLDVQRELSQALDQTGRFAESIPLWSGLCANAPTDDKLERSWIQALLLGGDPRAEEARASWLRRHPEDEELRSMSQTGPQLAPEPQYTPQNSHQDLDEAGHDPH